MNHFLTALTAIRRSPYQAVAAIMILSITFFVGYTFSLFIYSSEIVLRFFETRPQVTAYFKLDVTPDQLNQVASDLTTKSYIDGVNIISKEQALEIYRKANQKDPLLLELVTADILPPSIEARAKTPDDLPTIKADLEKASGVDTVSYQEDVLQKLRSITKGLRVVGLSSVVLLASISFLIIFIISGLRVAMKRKAIQIMRVLGATKWYVKAPFVFEGMIYGLTGSVLGWSGTMLGLLYLTPTLQNFLKTIPLLPFPLPVLAAQLGAGSLLGMLLGAFASSVAVQRMMKRT
jgi:cell division transport system permease protein